MDRAYYIRDRNRVSGPFDVDTLRRFARGRRLARHHQLSTDRLTWERAVEVLPEVFSISVHRPGREVATQDLAPGDDDVECPPQPTVMTDDFAPTVPTRGGGVPWGPIVAGSAVVVGLAALGGFVWLMVGLGDTTWSETRVAREFAPKLTVVRGSQPDGAKASCFGVVVSRHHVVVPLAAAWYRSPKVESVTEDGDSEWHTATLVLVDPDAKLAVLRADLGQAVEVLAIPEDRLLPGRNDDLYLVAPDRRGIEATCRAELDQVLEKGRPDQTLVLSFEDEAPADDEVVGRAVVDEQGRFAGIVVGVGPDGRVMCTAANEVRIKRGEAKKLPLDHALAPLDVAEPRFELSVGRPDAAPETATSRRRDEPAMPADAAETNNERTPRPRPDEAPAPDEEPGPGTHPRLDEDGPEDVESAGRDGKVDERALPGKSGGIAATLGDAGAGVVSSVTDAVTPRLAEDRARELGRNHLDSVLREHARCRDERATARVQRLCAEVLKAAGEDRGAYTVTVTEDSTVNAYAFVGRNLVVTTGFLEFAGRDDDMIRFVLAHETGHIVLGHTDEPYRRLEMANELAPGGELAAGFAQSVFKNSPMNQAQEKAADRFAVSHLRRAGLPVEGGIRFFRKIDPGLAGRPSRHPIGALFSSHPDVEGRIEAISSANVPPQ